MRFWCCLPVVIAIAIQAGVPPREVRGSVLFEGGGAVVGVSAVVFPADEQQWSSPRIAELARVVPITNGAFRLTAVPSRDYRIGFTSEEAAKEFPSPALFKRLLAAGAMPLVPDTVELEAVLTRAGPDYRIVTSKLATASIATVRSSPGQGPLAPIGRGRSAPPPPPGSITGHVLDQSGQRLSAIDVRLLRRRDLNGRFDYLPIGAAVKTDQDGRYVLPASAGEYVLLASPYSLEMSREPQSTRRAPASEPGEKGVTQGYVPTFYPSAAEHIAATVVVVANQEVPGIDIRLARQAVFEVEGSIDGIVKSFGISPRMTVSTTTLGPMMAANLARWVPIESDGKFRVPDLQAGEYIFSFSNQSGWARETVRIDAGTPPVKLSLQPPMTVTGEVEFHGESPRPDFPPPAPGRPPSFQYRIELAPVAPVSGASAGPAMPIASGSFSTWSSGPGPFRLRATYPAPWIQVSGFVDGIDTLDAPLEYGSPVKDARIVLADRPTSLVINVRDANDRPMPNVLVALFAEDERYWASGSRRAQTGPSSPVGTVTFSGLPAGKYLVVAAPELPANVPASALLFRRLLPRAMAVELALRESKSIQLTTNR